MERAGGPVQQRSPGAYLRAGKSPRRQELRAESIHRQQAYRKAQPLEGMPKASRDPELRVLESSIEIENEVSFPRLYIG